VPEPGWIEGADLEKLLPHRGLNLLVDAVRAERDKEGARGEGRLVVLPDDPLGRDIFLREAGSGRELIEPALAEHLALVAICVMSPDMKPGEIAFFSAISAFESERPALAGEELFSEVTRLRDRGRFRRFRGEVRGDEGAPSARAEIMAYTARPDDAAGRETAKALAPPDVAESSSVDRSRLGWKRPEMVFLDERTSLSADGASATFRYTYPPGHPFCAGHFPGNPVMMGIAQWIAASDAAFCLMSGQAPPRRVQGARHGPVECRADAEIVRESGALVCEVKGLELEAAGLRPAEGPSAPQAGGAARVTRTRRVGFRDRVLPGETLYVRVRVTDGINRR
jgi:3-hydroxymyristoyl/3-hydroxydecanoyl-(acyl carrier protein) dehydratase